MCGTSSIVNSGSSLLTRIRLISSQLLLVSGVATIASADLWTALDQRNHLIETILQSGMIFFQPVENSYI